MYAGSGTDSLVGGGGNDTYVFGPLTQGNVTVNDGSTTNNTLDFSLFGAGINLDLEAVGPPAREPGTFEPDPHQPAQHRQVLGTSYPDTIMGNGRNDTLIGNGGADYLNARGGAALIEGYKTTVVYLDFLPGAVDYSAVHPRRDPGQDRRDLFGVQLHLHADPADERAVLHARITTSRAEACLPARRRSSTGETSTSPARP